MNPQVFFLRVDIVIELEEAFEDLFSGLRGNGVASAIVFRKVVHVVEVVGEVDVCPAVGGKDGVVHFFVELAEVEEVFVGLAGCGFVLFAQSLL